MRFLEADSVQFLSKLLISAHMNISEMLLKLSQYVAEANRIEDLMIFSLTEKQMSLSYNLIADGTTTQLRDRIVNRSSSHTKRFAIYSALAQSLQAALWETPLRSMPSSRSVLRARR